MVKKVGFITLHGMGETKKNYADDLLEGVKERLGDDAWSEVSFQSVYYQKILQDPQYEFYDSVKGKVDSKAMRRFWLYKFSDPAALEYSRNIPDSAYELSQRKIFEALSHIQDELEDPEAPVIVVAQSLGGQVISNYIWDANRPEKPGYGLWRHYELDEHPFQRLQSMRLLLTTGCNIPIFVGGLPSVQRPPIGRPHPEMIWENYYDEDDALGWPLQDLNDAYDDLVTDIAVNVGGKLSSWNPLAHSKYWSDKDIQQPVADHLASFLE
jgi:hypothetical protein